jgi:peptidylprolyl isomerase
MKLTILLLLMAAAAATASAQTPAKQSATPAPATATPSTANAGATASKPLAASPAIAAFIKAPASIPQYKGIQKPIFTIALRYQEIKVGTGALAEPGKMYKVHYTGWRAADGVKFDSSFDHPGQPVKDKDGKPVLGADGKPEVGPPQPMQFPQGMGRLIPGFDQGFTGMKIGGKRRILIPWQLAYGMREIPDHGPEHPGIPAKSDLIFDVELVDVTDMPPPPSRPGMGGPPGAHPMPGVPPHPGAPGAPAAPAQQNPGSSSNVAPGAAPAPATPAAPATAPAPPTTANPGATPAPAAPPATTAPATPTAPPQPK